MMQEGRDGESGVARGELVPVGQPGSVREWAEQLVARAREDGLALTGEGGLLTDLMRHVLQTGLEVEMAEHLGYGPHERAGRGSGNSRNGAYDKPSRRRAAATATRALVTGGQTSGLTRTCAAHQAVSVDTP